MGAVETYHVESVDAWDVAAGKLIIEEAGGIVQDTSGKNTFILQIHVPSFIFVFIFSLFTGGELNLMVPRVIAACNQQIADQLVKLFEKSELEQPNKYLS